MSGLGQSNGRHLEVVVAERVGDEQIASGQLLEVDLGIGAGLSSVETGLRLRYEFVPEFAPYIGVGYERKIGNTADFARAEGEDVGGWSALVGVRTWF